MANKSPLKIMIRTSPFIFASLILFWFGDLCAIVPSAEKLERADSAIRSLVDDNLILGAQLRIGHYDKQLMERNYGVRSADDPTPVNSETLFCIGSCSKPIASAVIMTLVDDDVLALDEPISNLLPIFGSLKTKQGESSRAPTLIELLSHHGGIYSQKKGMTRRQTRWIRNFRLTLEDAVNGIGNEPLYAPPGAEYAYSGAGYCVLGRVAEVAAETSFESLLQARICEPLELTPTSYFPAEGDMNIASGSLNGKPNRTTPHLSKPFRLPLIGGSLYSTSRDSAKFLQAILAEANDGTKKLITSDLFKTYTTQYSDKKPYALGWSLMMGNGKSFGLAHSGALASSRALFRINLESGVYVAFLYTISDPKKANELGRSLSQIMSSINGRR